jgi:hypothetical protein
MLSDTRRWSPALSTDSSVEVIADRPEGTRATPAQCGPPIAINACCNALVVGVP